MENCPSEKMEVVYTTTGSIWECSLLSKSFLSEKPFLFSLKKLGHPNYFPQDSISLESSQWTEACFSTSLISNRSDSMGEEHSPHTGTVNSQNKFIFFLPYATYQPLCKSPSPLCFVTYPFMYMFVLKKHHHGLLSRDVLWWKARTPIESESNITHCQQMPLPDPPCRPEEESLSSSPVSKPAFHLHHAWYTAKII